MLPDIKRILYTTDLSDEAPKVFRYALKLARDHQAEITILHALEPLSTFAKSLVELHVAHSQSELMHGQARDTVKNTIEKRLEELCEHESCLGPDGREMVKEILVLEEQPAEAILATSRKIEADLIVMGSHHKSSLGDALLGSTAIKVLHRSVVPVFLVR